MSPRLSRRAAVSALLLAALLLQGCSSDDDQPDVSDSVSALRALVDVPAVVAAARWETFGTPEHKGGLPGPTDYITLIAELTPAKVAWIEALPPIHRLSLVPEAARPWLSAGFRVFLERHRNSTVAPPSDWDCRAYASRVVTSARPVNGFVCRSGDKALLYMTLASST